MKDVVHLYCVAVKGRKPYVVMAREQPNHGDLATRIACSTGCIPQDVFVQRMATLGGHSLAIGVSVEDLFDPSWVEFPTCASTIPEEWTFREDKS